MRLSDRCVCVPRVLPPFFGTTAVSNLFRCGSLAHQRDDSQLLFCLYLPSTAQQCFVLTFIAQEGVACPLLYPRPLIQPIFHTSGSHHFPLLGLGRQNDTRVQNSNIQPRSISHSRCVLTPFTISATRMNKSWLLAVILGLGFLLFYQRTCSSDGVSELSMNSGMTTQA